MRKMRPQVHLRMLNQQNCARTQKARNRTGRLPRKETDLDATRRNSTAIPKDAPHTHTQKEKRQKKLNPLGPRRKKAWENGGKKLGGGTWQAC
jgi:hypothetical protein